MSFIHEVNWPLRLYISATLFCLLTSSYGQVRNYEPIKAHYYQNTMDLILLDLKIKYQFTFYYEVGILPKNRMTISLNRLTIAEAMDKLLIGTGLNYRVEEKQVYIFKGSITETKITASTEIPSKKNFSVSGIIKDKQTGESLPYANILISGSTNGTTTNGDGYFTLFNVPSDTTLLEISYLGYKTIFHRLSPKQSHDELIIYTEDEGINLEEVVVKANKEEQLIKASTGIGRVNVVPGLLSKLPSYGEKDIFRALQLLPGISGTQESSSGLYVRGGTPDQNLILFDGFTVYHVDHLFGFFSAFNPNAIKDLQIFKGGFESRYGGRISSVVDLTGKDGNNAKFNAGGGISLLSYSAFIETPFAKSKGSFLVAGRKSLQSNFYKNIFNSFVGNKTTLPSSNTSTGFPGGRFGRIQADPNSFFYDLNAKVTYRTPNKDIFSLSLYNGQDDLDNSRDFNNSIFGNRPIINNDVQFERTSSDLTKWGNWGLSGRWSRKWNEKYYSNLILSYSNYYSNRDRRDNTVITRNDTTTTQVNGNLENNNLKNYMLKWDNEYKLNQYNQLGMGLQIDNLDIAYNYTQNDSSKILDRRNKGYISSYYLQDKLTMIQKIIITPGIRTTHYNVTRKIYLEPRVSAIYVISEQLKLKAAWGKYNQFATRVIREDIMQGSRDFWILADDEQIPISTATHYIGGISYETKHYLFDIELYHKPMEGLTEYTSRFVPNGFGPGSTLNYEEFFYNGRGVARGLEILAQKKSGALTGWIGYTLGKVKHQFDVYGSNYYFANHDQTHEGKVVTMYTINSKLSLSSTFIYATGKPYTAPVGYYELKLLNGSTSDFFEISNKNSLRLPNYHRLDISLNYDFNLGKSKGNTGISVFNVYNRKNVWYKQYDVIEGDLIETNVSLLGLTPSIFINWSLR